jgi:hypothetical protein
MSRVSQGNPSWLNFFFSTFLFLKLIFFSFSSFEIWLLSFKFCDLLYFLFYGVITGCELVQLPLLTSICFSQHFFYWFSFGFLGLFVKLVFFFYWFSFSLFLGFFVNFFLSRYHVVSHKLVVLSCVCFYVSIFKFDFFFNFIIWR